MSLKNDDDLLYDFFLGGAVLPYRVILDMALAGGSGHRIVLYPDYKVGYLGPAGESCTSGTSFKDGSPHSFTIQIVGGTAYLLADYAEIASVAVTPDTVTRMALGSDIGETAPANVTVHEAFYLEQALT